MEWCIIFQDLDAEVAAEVAQPRDSRSVPMYRSDAERLLAERERRLEESDALERD